MSCNNQLQVYWSGTSFLTATAFFSDPALTSPSPDGFYAFGAFVREIANGILLPAVPCESCVIPCGSPFNFGGGSTGEYNVSFSMGVNPGAAIITFSPGVSNFTYFPVPDQCTWTYVTPSEPYVDLIGSEYSTLTGGYLKGLIGAFDSPTYNSDKPCLSLQNPAGVLITSAAGTVNTQSIGNIHDWNQTTSSFTPPTTLNAPLGSIISPIGWTGIFNNTGDYQSTLLNWNCSNKSVDRCGCDDDLLACNTSLGVPSSPYNDNLPLAPNLMSFGAGGTKRFEACGLTVKPAVMVVPSPPGIPTTNLKVTVSGPCTSTWWGIDVQCPVLLTAIPSSTKFGKLEDDQTAAGQLTKTPLADVCQFTIDTTFYHVPVDNWGNTNPNSFYYDNDIFPGSPPTGQPNGVLGLSDWIYEDPYGVTPVAVGVYKMQFDALDGGGPKTWAVQVGPREYKDLSTNGTTTSGQLNPLPPEDYVGQIWAPDWASGITSSDVQKTGPRKPGIVRSITPCYAISFNCVNNTCVDPQDGTGQYATLSACEAACIAPVSFACVNSVCLDPGNGSGPYSTLLDCQAVCNPPAPCSEDFFSGQVSNGQYSIDMDAGATTGAVIIRFQPYTIPNKFTWTYDGVSASEYSSPNEGYLEGLIGTISAGNVCGVAGGVSPITNALGSNGVTYSGFSHVWNDTQQQFIQGAAITIGPYTASEVNLTTNQPNYVMMVIPKPNASPSLVQMQLEGPCGSTVFDISAYCPVKLSRKERGAASGVCKVYTTQFYTASPHTSDGLSSSDLQVHDWVFEDDDGVTALPAGVYPAKYPGGPDNIMTVSANGVITSLVACP